MLNIANDILQQETRSTSGHLNPKQRNIEWHSMLATPSLDDDRQNAHRSIHTALFGGILDRSYEEVGINRLLDSPDPAMLESARLKRDNPSALTLVQNNQIAFRYTGLADVAYADMRADTGICTIWKSFWGEGRLKSFTELSVEAAVDAHINPSDVPADFKKWMPAPHDDNWNEDKTEFMVLTFEECLIYVAIDVRKGTQNTLKSAHNIHYLVILIILFLRYPQYNFTSGYAVPRGEPAHTDPIFTEMGGASEEEHSHGSNKGSGDGVSAQSLSDAQRKARDKIIWLLAKLEGRGGGGE